MQISTRLYRNPIKDDKSKEFASVP